jgi:predicted nucleotide-binding protein
MATRRSAPPPPQAPALTSDQIRRRIEQLRQCIGELEAFDPEQVQRRYREPEVMRLEASIDEALTAAFGHRTPAYDRYRQAAKLDHGPHTVRGGDAFGRLPQIDYEAQDARDARKYFAEGKVQSITLIEQAIRALEHQIADQEPDGGAAAAPAAPELDLSKVFIVHGHDRASKAEVDGFIRKLGLEPIILHERPNKGRTLITKFREEAAGAGFAVVLMTPDDLGKAETAAELNPRARQNVVFELGFFVGKLGPERVAALFEGNIEIPSDFDGVVYISLDEADWQTKLGLELQAADYVIDWNKLMRR